MYWVKKKVYNFALLHELQPLGRIWSYQIACAYSRQILVKKRLIEWFNSDLSMKLFILYNVISSRLIQIISLDNICYKNHGLNYTQLHIFAQVKETLARISSATKSTINLLLLSSTALFNDWDAHFSNALLSLLITNVCFLCRCPSYVRDRPSSRSDVRP